MIRSVKKNSHSTQNAKIAAHVAVFAIHLRLCLNFGIAEVAKDGGPTMIKELKPCPFCGGEAGLKNAHNGFTVVVCETCGCRTRGHTASEMQNAVDDWNSRGYGGYKDD